MDEIGAKLREIRDKYGSESVVVNTFVCSYPSNWAALHGPLMTLFIYSFGATANELETIDSHNAFAAQVDFGSSFRYMNFDLSTLSNYKQIIIWGSNPLGAARAVATSLHGIRCPCIPCRQTFRIDPYRQTPYYRSTYPLFLPLIKGEKEGAQILFIFSRRRQSRW